MQVSLRPFFNLLVSTYTYLPTLPPTLLIHLHTIFLIPLSHTQFSSNHPSVCPLHPALPSSFLNHLFVDLFITHLIIYDIYHILSLSLLPLLLFRFLPQHLNKNDSQFPISRIAHNFSSLELASPRPANTYAKQAQALQKSQASW